MKKAKTVFLEADGICPMKNTFYVLYYCNHVVRKEYIYLLLLYMGRIFAI